MTHIATSSEDQTCKIFEFKDGELNHTETLGGHSLAVTSIDWKDDTFISCSDDKTLRVYKVMSQTEGLKFQLQFILDTKFITCWHTLTYMHLQPIPNDLYLVSAVSENGYLFQWTFSRSHSDIILKYSRKISNGSIEALSVRRLGDKVVGVTCSSDLTHSLLKFNLNEPSFPEAKI